MGLTGKYSFPGIQKAGTAALKVVLSSFGWGIWFLKSPFNFIPDMLFDMLLNWLANQGLIVMNIGAIYVNGQFDQMGFDKAMDEGLRKLGVGRDKLTPEQGKAIDEACKNAFRKFAPYTSK